MQTAEVNDFDGGAQVENAGRFRSSDLADAVADHRRWP